MLVQLVALCLLALQFPCCPGIPLTDSSSDEALQLELQPLLFQPLPAGAVKPQGWLGAQLQLHVDGLPGSLVRFWQDVSNSTWFQPGSHWHETSVDRGGNLPYWLNAMIPLAYMDLTPSDGFPFKATLVAILHKILDLQQEHWGSRDIIDMSDKYNLGTWNLIRTFRLFLQADPDTPRAAEFEDFIFNWIAAAEVSIQVRGFETWPEDTVASGCNKWAPDCTVYQCPEPYFGNMSGMCHGKVRGGDYINVLQELVDSDIGGISLNQTRQGLVWQHMNSVHDWAFSYQHMVWRPNDAPPPYPGFPTVACGGPSDKCEKAYENHNVNFALNIKGGALWWRVSANATWRDSVQLMLSKLDRYHGRPDGSFSGDEHLAGRSPSRGIETCGLADTLASLHMSHRILGDVALADRVESIAFNSYAAASTPSQWEHVYVHAMNEVIKAPSEVPISSDGGDAWLYGCTGCEKPVSGEAIGGSCCTANGMPRGWPEFVLNTVQIRPSDGAIFLVLLAPVEATVPSPTSSTVTYLNVTTDYPFDDQVTVQVRATASVSVYVRVPGWAEQASVTVTRNSTDEPSNDRSHTPRAEPQPTKNGTYYEVDCGVGTTTIVLQLNPTVLVETGWGYSDGLVVKRGPLLYAYAVNETQTALATFPELPTGRSHTFTTTNSLESSASCEWPCWNIALRHTNNSNIGAAAADFVFQRIGPIPREPFRGGDQTPVRIVAKARRLDGWTMNPLYNTSVQEPPNSPVCTGPGSYSCSQEEYNVVLIPYGSTRLRIAVLPWYT